MAAIALAIAAVAVLIRAASEYDTAPATFARTADPNQIVVEVTVGLGDEIVATSCERMLDR